MSNLTEPQAAVHEALTETNIGMGNPPAHLWHLYTPEGVAIALLHKLKKAGWTLVKAEGG